jgi:hypothetical protein
MEILALYLKASMQLFDCLENLYLKDELVQLDPNIEAAYWSGVKAYVYSMIQTSRNFHNSVVEFRILDKNNPEAEPKIERIKLTEMPVGKRMAVIMNVPWVSRVEGHA